MSSLSRQRDRSTPARFAPTETPPSGFSALLRRILLVNVLPLVLLVAALLYLNQYQNALLAAKVTALREQARLYAAALGESVVRETGSGTPEIDQALARPLLYRLIDPAPGAQAQLYEPNGRLIADSQVRPGPGGAVVTESLPPATPSGLVMGMVGWLYDQVLPLLGAAGTGEKITNPDAPSSLAGALRLFAAAPSQELAPYIRRVPDSQLLVTVTEPVLWGEHVVGIVLLTRNAAEVDRSLFAVRLSILGLFLLALALTVMLSVYLSRTIARPILRLAVAAEQMREGHGRFGAVPQRLLARRDEIGVLAHAVADSARALWARMDAIERFAADVAHEIKNPLSSIRSAIDTLHRSPEKEQRLSLLDIIAADTLRLDRLINDISDASRLDAELSRAATEPVDVAPILATLAEIGAATEGGSGPSYVVEAPQSGLTVQAVEGRVVQVLRNLIGNAVSFSPPGGRIWLRARASGPMIEIAVEDEGPGIPEGKLEHIFDRFYSERPAGDFGQHSGLGLSISRQIVEALHGRISAENRYDASGRVLGARFTVRLPRAGATPTVAKTAA